MKQQFQVMFDLLKDNTVEKTIDPEIQETVKSPWLDVAFIVKSPSTNSRPLTQLCNPTGGCRVPGLQGSRSVAVPKLDSAKNGPPLPDPEIETEQSLQYHVFHPHSWR